MTIDPNHPRHFTEGEREQLRRLGEMRDDDIDYSDIPPSPTDAKWTRPGRSTGASSPEVVAIDADLLEHFATGGRADPFKVNAALREYMKAHENAS